MKSMQKGIDLTFYSCDKRNEHGFSIDIKIPTLTVAIKWDFLKINTSCQINKTTL